MGYEINPTRCTPLYTDLPNCWPHEILARFTLFSKIAQTYNLSDVFNTEELRDIVSLYAIVTIADGTMVHDWRSVLITWNCLVSEVYMTFFL